MYIQNNTQKILLSINLHIFIPIFIKLKHNINIFFVNSIDTKYTDDTAFAATF